MGCTIHCLYMAYLYFSNAARSRILTNLAPDIRDRVYCILHPENYHTEDTSEQEEEDDEEEQEESDEKWEEENVEKEEKEEGDTNISMVCIRKTTTSHVLKICYC